MIMSDAPPSRGQMLTVARNVGRRTSPPFALPASATPLPRDEAREVDEQPADRQDD